jgi:hypothetical protein
VHNTRDVPLLIIPAPSNEHILPDVVDAQLDVEVRLQFLGRDAMLPSVVATPSLSRSDPAHTSAVMRMHLGLPSDRVVPCHSVEALK